MRADTEHDLRSLEATAAPAAGGAEVAADTGAADPFAGDLSSARVGELQRALIDRFAAPGPIEVALSSVTSIDAAGLQLLLAARRAATARGRELRFTDPSEPVRHLFDRIGEPR